MADRLFDYYYVRGHSRIVQKIDLLRKRLTSSPSKGNQGSYQDDQIPASSSAISFIIPDFKFNFTTLGVSGRYGPNDTAGYEGTTLEHKVKLQGGIQMWQVPRNGSYVIEAWGASGQDSQTEPVRKGGKGAYMKGTFNLTRGTLLRILIGQRGRRGNVEDDMTGGGGGGTFVVLSTGSPLIIAGGGGGGGALKDESDDGDPGQTTEYGSRYGGHNGSGGKIKVEGDPSGSFEAGAGGGLIGDGEPAQMAEGGKSFRNGGVGGNSPSEMHGGFGGGGAGIRYPGAGGGYSGGSVFKNSEGKTIAGGGGSLNAGADQVKEAGANQGNGRVMVSLVRQA